MIVDEAECDLDRWYGILELEKVEIWHSAPTAIRIVMQAGADSAAKYDFPRSGFWAASASH